MKNNKFLLKNLREPFVVILIGPPLVGKSTMIKTWLENYTGEIDVISRDAIVLEEHGSNDYSAAFKSVNQKNVNKILKSKLEGANSDRHNAIVDMTNLTSNRREDTLSKFDEDYYKVAIIFPEVKWEELKKRNENRKITENKFIPEFVIKNMINSYQSIKDKEGFNKIINL